MREALDSVLKFINEAVLSDSEWAKADALLPAEVTAQDEYKALLFVLQEREGTSNAAAKLANYYAAKGIAVSSEGKGYSNIFIGVPLE